MLALVLGYAAPLATFAGAVYLTTTRFGEAAPWLLLLGLLAGCTYALRQNAIATLLGLLLGLGVFAYSLAGIAAALSDYFRG